MSEKLEVQLGDRSYPIYVGEKELECLAEHVRQEGLGETCLIVSDTNVDPLYGDRVEQVLASAGFKAGRAVVEAGEPSKDGAKVFELYDRAVEAKLDRKSFIVALGGGVVGDLAGFVAATYLRGIDYVQVPTSLLAMVDSSVGGKTGVNLPHGKNLVGSFYQPALVLADLDTLDSLPPREFRAGIAEVIKYGVIWDAGLFETLETHQEYIKAGDKVLLETIVSRCCSIKADVVKEDEKETSGLRAILNYGHTVGHAIEKIAGYGQYLHGEAISVGMVFAAHLSTRLTGFPEADMERLVRLFEAFELPVRAPELSWDELREAITVDKKSVGSIPRFVLAEEMGTVQAGCEVTEKLMQEAWRVCSE